MPNMRIGGRQAERRRSRDGLGRQLGRMEGKVYQIIFNSGIKPISSVEIFREIFPLEERAGRDESRGSQEIWMVVSRIRDKLGETAILTHEEGGFTSRKAMIDLGYFKGKERTRV